MLWLWVLASLQAPENAVAGHGEFLGDEGRCATQAMPGFVLGTRLHLLVDSAELLLPYLESCSPGPEQKT